MKVKPLTLLAASLLFLSGCGPQVPMIFGVPQSQWQHLSPAERQQVIAGYNERQKINAQNAPLNNAINAAGTAAMWHQMNENMPQG